MGGKERPMTTITPELRQAIEQAERVLAVVLRMREGIRQHEVHATGHAPPDGKSCAVIDARGRAFATIIGE